MSWALLIVGKESNETALQASHILSIKLVKNNRQSCFFVFFKEVNIWFSLAKCLWGRTFEFN